MLQNLQTTNGCTGGIPSSYTLLSLPFDTPVLNLTASAKNVSMCSDSFYLDIFNSKGMTSRDPQNIVWNVVSVGALTTSALKTTLDNYVNSKYANMNFMKLDRAKISSITNSSQASTSQTSEPVEFKVSATNFLGKSSTIKMIIYFLNYKQVIIKGVYSSYVLHAQEENYFDASAKIPI